MKGTTARVEHGFTIIETMVYLAIAGVLFLVTIVYLGDKQRQTQFTQGVREFESVLNDIANDTSTGVFPVGADIECTTAATVNNRIRFTDANTPSGDEQVLPGENNSCIFVGSVVQLTNNGTNGSTDSDFYTHTLVGVNENRGGATNITSNFEQATPRPLYESGTVDATQEFQIPWGVTITDAFADNTPINGLAYLYSNFGESLAAGGLKTGAANISLYVNESSIDESLDGFRSSINYDVAPAVPSIEPIGQRVVLICLTGNDGRRAMLEVGSESGTFNARANFNTGGTRCG